MTQFTRVVNGRTELRADLFNDLQEAIEQQSFNVMRYGATGDGVTDDSAAFSDAMDAALATGGIVLVPATTASYLLDTAISKTLGDSEVLRIVGVGQPTLTFGQGDGWTFTGDQVASTTLNGTATVGGLTLTLTSTTGMAAGDLLLLAVPLVVERTYYRDQVEIHAIESVDSDTQVTLSTPLEFTAKANADQTWAGDNSETTFWYPSYFVQSGNIQVYLDGVLQSSGYSLIAHDSDSNHYGFDVTFDSAPGSDVAVVVKNASKVPVTVYRGGLLRVENLRLTSATEGNYLTARYLTGPILRDLDVSADADSTTGDYLLLSDCLAPRVRGIITTFGRYCIHIRTCRNAHVSEVTAHRSWHPVSMSSWAVDSVVENVVGYSCAAIVDAHPSLRSHYRNCWGFDSGINNRGSGGSMVNVHVYDRGSGITGGFTNGILWMDNSADEEPDGYRPFRESFLVQDSTFYAPSETGMFSILVNQCDRAVFRHVVADGTAGTAGTYARIGLNTLVVEDSDIAIIEPRRVDDRIILRGGRIGYINFNSSVGSNPVLMAHGVTFDNATQSLKSDIANLELGYRSFTDCLFTGATALIDGIGTTTSAKSYDFTRCRFHNIGGFSTDIKDNGGTYIGCRFTGTTTSQAPAAYTPINVSADRGFDANNTTTDELADVLGTLIDDLQELGVLR